MARASAVAIALMCMPLPAIEDNLGSPRELCHDLLPVHMRVRVRTSYNVCCMWMTWDALSCILQEELCKDEKLFGGREVSSPSKVVLT